MLLGEKKLCGLELGKLGRIQVGIKRQQMSRQKGFLSKSTPDVGVGAPLPGDLVLTGEKGAGGSRASSIGMVTSWGPGAASSWSLPASDSTHSRSSSFLAAFDGS